MCEARHSTAIRADLYHPRCKDSHTTYFEGVSTPPELPSIEEKRQTIKDYNQQQKTQYVQNQAKKCLRIAKYSLDEDNKRIYSARAKQWENKANIYNKSVVKSADGDIIKENSVKPITKITDLAIEKVPRVNINGYTEEQCTEIQKQHKELLKYARDNNNDNEVAFAFRKNITDKTIFLGSENELNFGVGLDGKGTDLFVMHNHPRNSSYSYTDLAEFIGNSSIKTLSIVKNNGNVEVLTKVCECDRLKLATEFERMKRNMLKTGSDAEYNKIVEKFLIKQRKNGVFEWLN